MKGRDAGDGGEEGFEEDEVDNADKKRSAQFNAVRKEYVKKHLFRNSSMFIVYFKATVHVCGKYVCGKYVESMCKEYVFG